MPHPWGSSPPSIPFTRVCSAPGVVTAHHEYRTTALSRLVGVFSRDRQVGSHPHSARRDGLAIDASHRPKDHE